MNLAVQVTGDAISGWLVEIRGSSNGNYAQKAATDIEAAENALSTHRHTTALIAAARERQVTQETLAELSKQVADISEKAAAALAEVERLKNLTPQPGSLVEVSPEELAAARAST